MRPLLLLLLLTAMPATAGVVDRVVLVVDDELVLESDVRLEAVLSGLDTPILPFWSRTHGTPEERLLEAALVRALAEGVRLYEPSDEAVAARVARIRARLGDDRAWQAFGQLWGLDDARFVRLVRRRMRVERYLARNLAESPDDPDAWLAATHALLDQVKARFRVRRVAPRGSP